MPAPNFLNCGPRSCAHAGAPATSPTNVTHAAAALILMKVLLTIAFCDAPKLSRDSSGSLMSEMGLGRVKAIIRAVSAEDRYKQEATARSPVRYSRNRVLWHIESPVTGSST